MRTSRLSRDTSRIIGALASRTRSTRAASSSISASRGESTTRRTTSRTLVVKKEEDEDDGGDVSDAGSAYSASHIDDDVDVKDSKRTVTKVARKRKRGESIVAAGSATKIKENGEASASAKPKKMRRQPAKKVTTATGEVKVEPPSNWEEIYSLTREMRSKLVAPVDTMGCESLADTSQSPKDQRLQTLVALMMSSQTKDTVTSVAMKNLQRDLPGGFDLDGLLKVSPEDLDLLINKVGFHNKKTIYIKQVAEILRDKFNGDIPDTIEGLVSLPGVGPKMAYLCMSAAWGRDEGIGVDVHVHRITNLWGWHKTKTPEETRAALESWLPKDKWHDINNLLVGFGQTICAPVGRKCGDCMLAERGLCPASTVRRVIKKEVKKEESEGEDDVVVKKEVKKEESEGEDDVVVKEESDQVAQKIKIEDTQQNVPDIEDILGRSHHR